MAPAWFCGCGFKVPLSSPARVSTTSGAPASAITSNSSAAVCSGGIATARCSRIGPVSRPSSSSMVVLPVKASPMATAHWIGAAPRYRGSSEPCRLMQPSFGSASIQGGIMRPYATTTMAAGAMASSWARNSWLLRILSGCVTSMPAASAACFTGGAVSCCPRPTGLSGCETTSAISWPAPSRASSVGTANRGVPQKTSFTGHPRNEGKLRFAPFQLGAADEPPRSVRRCGFPPGSSWHYHSPARCILRILRRVMSRFSALMRKMNSIPSTWSISC